MVLKDLEWDDGGMRGETAVKRGSEGAVARRAALEAESQSCHHRLQDLRARSVKGMTDSDPVGVGPSNPILHSRSAPYPANHASETRRTP